MICLVVHNNSVLLPVHTGNTLAPSLNIASPDIASPDIASPDIASPDIKAQMRCKHHQPLTITT
jgi:hypothetical protein